MAERHNFKNLTPEEREVILAKSHESRRRNEAKKKKYKEIIELLGVQKLNPEHMDEFIEDFKDVDPEVMDEVTLDVATTLSMYREAIKYGNVTAATWIRDTAGQKPVDKLEHQNAMPVFLKDDFDETSE